MFIKHVKNSGPHLKNMLRYALFVLLLLPFLVTSRPTTKPLTGIHIIDGLCLPKRADRLVYRYENDTHVYIAFDVLKTGKVHVYAWELIKANQGTFISELNKHTVLAVDFRKYVNRNHVIGSIGKRHYKKFKTRMERKMKFCEKQRRKKKKRCKRSAIMSVFVRTNMRNANFNVDDCIRN